MQRKRYQVGGSKRANIQRAIPTDDGMNAHQAILAALDLSWTVLNRYVGDLEDGDLMRRSPGCNHLAWQLGHLIASESALLEMVSPGSGVELPEDFAARHSKEFARDDNPAHFETKDRYLELMAEVHDATRAALLKTSEVDLDQPGPERFQSLCPTVGHVYVLIATHGLMHAGQFVPVRRELGKPIVI